MDRRQQLREVIERGSPSQAAYARELVCTERFDDVDLLYDAYLNDPYLTRY